MKGFLSTLPTTPGQYHRQSASSTYHPTIYQSSEVSGSTVSERIQHMQANYPRPGVTQTTSYKRSSHSPSMDYDFSDAYSMAESPSFHAAVSTSRPASSVGRRTTASMRPSTAAGSVRPTSLYSSIATGSVVSSANMYSAYNTISTATPPSSVVDSRGAASEVSSAMYHTTAGLPSNATGLSADSGAWQSADGRSTATESQHYSYYPHELLLTDGDVSAASAAGATAISAASNPRDSVHPDMTAFPTGVRHGETFMNPTKNYSITSGLCSPSYNFPSAFQQLEIRIVGLGVRSWAPAAFRTWTEMMNVHDVAPNSTRPTENTSSLMRFSIMDASGTTSQLHYDLRDSKNEADSRHVRSALFGGSKYRLQLHVNRSVFVPLAQPRSDVDTQPAELTLTVVTDQNDVLGVTQFTPPISLKNGAWALPASAVRKSRAIGTTAAFQGETTTRQDPAIVSVPLYRPDDFANFSVMTPQMKELGCIGKIFLRFVQTTAPTVSVYGRSGPDVLQGLEDHIDVNYRDHTGTINGRRSSSGSSNAVGGRALAGGLSGCSTYAPSSEAFATAVTSDIPFIKSVPFADEHSLSSHHQRRTLVNSSNMLSAVSRESYIAAHPPSFASFGGQTRTPPQSEVSGYSEASSHRPRRVSRPTRTSVLSVGPTVVSTLHAPPPPTEVAYYGGGGVNEDQRQQAFQREMEMRLQALEGRTSSQSDKSEGSFVSAWSSAMLEGNRSGASVVAPPHKSEFVTLSNMWHAGLEHPSDGRRLENKAMFQQVARPVEDTASAIAPSSFVSYDGHYEGMSVVNGRSGVSSRFLAHKH